MNDYTLRDAAETLNMTAPVVRKTSSTEQIPHSVRGPLPDGTDDATHVSAVLKR